MDAEQLDFPGDTFDVIVFSYVLSVLADLGPHTAVASPTARRSRSFQSVPTPIETHTRRTT